MKLYNIILADAGENKLNSKTAKPLFRICSKPIIEYVLDAASSLDAENTIIFASASAAELSEYFGNSFEIVSEEKLLIEAVSKLPNGSAVAVLSGSAPLIGSETLKDAFTAHSAELRRLTIVSEESETGIREKLFGEANSIKKSADIYFFDTDALKQVLASRKTISDSKHTVFDEAAKQIAADSIRIEAHTAHIGELFEVTDRAGLSAVGKIVNHRNIEKIMDGGVTVIAPDNTYIDTDVEVGRDTVIYPGCFLEGNTKIGEACVIGPDTTLRNSIVGNATTVERSVLTDSAVGDNTAVGPFAYLRPNSKVGSNVKIGDFVEVKNSRIDDGTKVSHLTYVGDSDVGKRVNFGCGTVTVNYDGINKHRTVIGDDAFIGCNTNLVAPVTVCEGAYTAAGSTITDEVPENALAIARSRQTNKENWVTENGKRKNK